MIGRKLDHYEIRRALGRGGMGEVYLARDTKLGRDVAIKLMPEDLQTDPERRSRFMREAQSIAALNHPNVVTIHAVEETEGRPYLVMEYVDGRTLDLEIPAGGLPADRFFDLALALTDAVAAAHAKGITHRDLKPQNVMLDAEGRLRVLDFGLAKLLEPPAASDDMTIAVDGQVTREGVIVGTAAYMSPEQAEGKPVDARSDVFSLGVLLYQMLTGRQAFQGDTQMSTLTSVLRDDPTPIPEIRPGLPRQMSRIMRRSLEKSPDRRYETARSLHYDLEVLREEMDSGEHEGPLATRPEGPPRSAAGGRFPLRWAILGLAAVVAVAVGYLGLRDGGEQETGERAVATVAEEGAAAADRAPTVVVFPFENLGPPEDAYFAAGITDEITTSLTGVEGIRVVSRTSALNYDRSGKSLKQIADDLGVDFVLEGSVRWQKGTGDESRVRVTPQLMNARADRQAWAEAYDRSMDEIFRVQSEIAAEVVRSLGVTMTGRGGPAAGKTEIPTDDMTAYHAYLKAAEIINTSRFEGGEWFLAVDLLEKAVERDPEFHQAWVLLAKGHAGMCHFDWDRSEARLAMAKATADRAMALQPDSPQSHYAMAQYYYWGLKDYERALESLAPVRAARPDDPLILETTAYVLRRQEKYAEAADLLIRAAEVSPRDAALCIHLTETLAIVGRYEEADAWGRKAMELGPDAAMNFTISSWAAVEAGRKDRARRYLADVPHFEDPELHMQAFRVYFELRDYASALKHAETLPESYETQYLAVSRDLAKGMTHLAMERTEEARDDFTRAEAAMRRKLVEKPDAANLVMARAVALAGMGRGDEALELARRSFELYPVNKDPWIRTWRIYDLAYIQMLAGRPAEAVETLDGLLRKQTDVISPAILRSSPHFDGLRDREDFQRLAAAHG